MNSSDEVSEEAFTDWISLGEIVVEPDGPRTVALVWVQCLFFTIGGWGGESFCETANREIVSFRSCVRAGEARRSCVGEREAIRLCS